MSLQSSIFRAQRLRQPGVMTLSGTMPDRLIAQVDNPDIDADECARIAVRATELAKADAPKLTGESSGHFIPIYGENWFGIHWSARYVWFQEHGINAFTMTRLAGKTIPMWIDDPTGKERAQNKKAQTRTTASGKVQVLIFRRAAKQGQRKIVRRAIRGVMTKVEVPSSYPGAPGRIGAREAARPNTAPGKTPGGIRRFNSGVRWRHPGLSNRGFLHNGMLRAAHEAGVEPTAILPMAGS